MTTTYKNLILRPAGSFTGQGGIDIDTSLVNLADRTGRVFAGGFNVLDYNGSGSAVQTTGTVSGGSAALVVASAASFAIGQGILVKGAGVAGAHLVTTIDNIVGTTITLHVAASTGVSGATVQHDDTAAINAALADCYNTGIGGIVFLPSGYYRVNGPFNGTTNSLLTVPQTYVNDLSGIVQSIQLLGQAPGATDGSNADTYIGGTLIDCRDAPTPSGTRPSFFAVRPYVLTTNGAVWNANSHHLRIMLDKLTVILPASAAFSGVQMNNCYQLIVGAEFTIYCDLTAGSPSVPTAGTAGIIWPQTLNNVKLWCGPCQVLGFDHGMELGEHLGLHGPYINFCNVGIYIPYNQHLIYGDVEVDSCPLFIGLDASAPASPIVDLRLIGEVAVNGHWWSAGSPWGLADPTNFLRGYIRYNIINVQTGTNGAALDVTGAANVHLTNLHA